MLFLKEVLLFSVFNYVAAAPSSGLVLHEKRGEVAHWIKRSAVPSEVRVPVKIGLKHSNLHLGHDLLMEMSDPFSENFGKHWTKEQVDDFFAPHEDSYATVFSWLIGANIDAGRLSTSHGRGLVTFEASIAEIEALLNTKYHLYEHVQSGDVSISCDEYSIHSSVLDHLDFITPTVEFSKVKSANVKRNLQKREINRRWANNGTSSNACVPDAIVPTCIKSYYGIPDGCTANPGNELGLYESFDTYDKKDLDNFFSTYYPQVPNGTYPILKSVDGGSAPASVKNATLVQGESVADLEMAYPIIHPQQIQLFQVGDLFQNASDFGVSRIDYLLDALDASYCGYEGGDNATRDGDVPDPHPGGYKGQKMCGAYKPPNVISISYGEEESSYTEAYVMRQCSEIMKLGMQGITFIVSSGDAGAVSFRRVCLPGGVYNPDYPATCPYLTSVGATKFLLNSSNLEEVAALDPDSEFSSGGGFSNRFSRPSYQDNAVSSYLSSVKGLNSSLFNSSGRGFPDVSGLGQNVVISLLGKFSIANGTSLAAPIFASMITLINEKRIESGKGPVGFLNPTLYQNPSMFNDIVSGQNWDCKNNTAFTASTGWDPVTGLGTPIFSKLMDVFVNLP